MGEAVQRGMAGTRSADAPARTWRRSPPRSRISITDSACSPVTCSGTKLALGADATAVASFEDGPPQERCDGTAAPDDSVGGRYGLASPWSWPLTRMAPTATNAGIVP